MDCIRASNDDVPKKLVPTTPRSNVGHVGTRWNRMERSRIQYFPIHVDVQSYSYYIMVGVWCERVDDKVVVSEREFYHPVCLLVCWFVDVFSRAFAANFFVSPIRGYNAPKAR